MKIDAGEVRSTLNGLIETCKDGEEGFRTAAEKLNHPGIKSEFLRFSLQRASFAGELQAEVTRMGSEPAQSGSTAGGIHRGWIRLKSAITGDTDQGILEEAERGEDAALKNYHDALAKNLPSDIQAIVSRQWQEIQQTHNTVKAVRDRGHTMTGRA
ncbi:MAG: PA2169 family four-helix-bundle protein [Acidobacteriota bacterium]|nr:PA2169 family four-helix-bundle protein [Acidobacteriota bacterium]